MENQERTFTSAIIVSLLWLWYDTRCIRSVCLVRDDVHWVDRNDIESIAVHAAVSSNAASPLYTGWSKKWHTFGVW